MKLNAKKIITIGVFILLFIALEQWLVIKGNEIIPNWTPEKPFYCYEMFETKNCGFFELIFNIGILIIFIIIVIISFATNS